MRYRSLCRTASCRLRTRGGHRIVDGLGDFWLPCRQSAVSSPITAYRLTLDRLRAASRALADHLERSDSRRTEFATDERFVEIWASYKRTLVECQAAFRQIPITQRMKVPGPPST